MPAAMRKRRSFGKHISPTPPATRSARFFRDRLCTLYNLALAKPGEVSLGSGEKLFKALVAYGLRQIDAAADENGRERAVNGLVQTFVAAAGRRAVRNGDDPFSDSTPPKFAADQPALPGVRMRCGRSPSSNCRRFSSGSSRNTAKQPRRPSA